MANGIYTKAKEAFLSGSINIPSDNIKAVLVDFADYTVNLATHQFLSDIPSGGRVGTTPNLAGKSVTGGVFDATDATITAVSGDPSEIVVVYKDTGSAATSPLISYHDTQSDGSTPISVTPNGGDITLVWDNGTNKILRLA